MHGIIIKKQAIVVAAAPPAIPKIGAKIQHKPAVVIEPNIKICLYLTKNSSLLI